MIFGGKLKTIEMANLFEINYDGKEITITNDEDLEFDIELALVTVTSLIYNFAVFSDNEEQFLSEFQERLQEEFMSGSLRKEFKRIDG